MGHADNYRRRPEISKDLIKNHDLIFPKNMIPISRSLCWKPWTAIRSINTTYPIKVFKGVDFKSLTFDEKWAFTVSRWLNVIDRADKYVDDEIVKSKIEKAKLCLSPGYWLDLKTKDPAVYGRCGLRFCLFCYTRSVVRLTGGLLTAYKRRPENSKCFLAFHKHKIEKSRLNEYIRKLRPAGAVTVMRPFGREYNKIWDLRAVLISDNHQRFDEREMFVREITGPLTIMVSAAKWLNFPYQWSLGRNPSKTIARAAKILESLPKGTQVFNVFGACSVDNYTSGKSWLDFDANCPKM